MISFMKIIVSAIKSYIDKIALTKADIRHTHESGEVITENGQTIDDVLDSLIVEGASNDPITIERIKEICTPIPTTNNMIPIADSDSLGCVKIGQGLGITEDGKISVGSTIIPNDTDLDSLLTEGVYSGVEVANSGYKNTPTLLPLGTSFTLEVFKSGDKGQIYQRLTNCSHNGVYTFERHYYEVNDGVGWGKWFRTKDTANRVLWSGDAYMTHTQTAFLSEEISSQPNGVVLIWSYYNGTTSSNIDFSFTFIPKWHVANFADYGFQCTTLCEDGHMCKYVYPTDTTIKGYKNNTGSFTVGGVTYNNSLFVLRYVIGI